MRRATTIAEARRLRRREREAGRRVALVPTMGALHEGHLALVRRAAELADSVWTSVFVNPTQFGPDEDLERYPRDLERDAALLEAEAVDVLFAPAVEMVYPRPPTVSIGFSGLERRLCGTSRPGHFAGVGLIVAKLLNIVEPEVAVFGQKDAQQAILVRRLVEDLDFATVIDIAPTVREPDGLALSSRNAYLDDQQRRAAPAIYRALCGAADAVASGERDPATVRSLIVQALADEPQVRLDYAECVSPDDLTTPERIDAPVLLAVAAHLGATRLIDNLLARPPR